MGLPKDLVRPAINHTSPSERDYLDTSLSTATKLQITDPSKSGADYGIKDPRVTEPLAGTANENGGA